MHRRRNRVAPSTPASAYQVDGVGVNVGAATPLSPFAAPNVVTPSILAPQLGQTTPPTRSHRVSRSAVPGSSSAAGKSGDAPVDPQRAGSANGVVSQGHRHQRTKARGGAGPVGSGSTVLGAASDELIDLRRASGRPRDRAQVKAEHLPNISRDATRRRVQLVPLKTARKTKMARDLKESPTFVQHLRRLAPPPLPTRTKLPTRHRGAPARRRGVRSTSDKGGKRPEAGAANAGPEVSRRSRGASSRSRKPARPRSTSSKAMKWLGVDATEAGVRPMKALHLLGVDEGTAERGDAMLRPRVAAADRPSKASRVLGTEGSQPKALAILGADAKEVDEHQARALGRLGCPSPREQQSARPFVKLVGRPSLGAKVRRFSSNRSESGGQTAQPSQDIPPASAPKTDSVKAMRMLGLQEDAVQMAAPEGVGSAKARALLGL